MGYRKLVRRTEGKEVTYEYADDCLVVRAGEIEFNYSRKGNGCRWSIPNQSVDWNLGSRKQRFICEEFYRSMSQQRYIEKESNAR